MSDRTVTVKLTADVKPYLAALAKAEAATKAFRDGLGKGMPDPFEPWDKETEKRKKRAPKDGEQIAGAFARAFSRRLEAAFQSLPKAKIDADSSQAQKRLQEVRAALQTLSAKRIGVDIDAASALAEIKTLDAELQRLGQSSEIDVRADTAAALAQLRTLTAEVDKLNGSTPTVHPDVDGARAQAELDELRRRLDELNVRRVMGVDLDDGAARSELNAIQRDLQRLNATSADPKVRLDSAQALAQARTVQSEMSRLDGRNARVKVDADVSGALRNIAIVAAALASLPSAVSIGVGAAGLGAAFGAAAAGAAGFAAVAVPGLSRVNAALKESESAAGGAGGAMKSAGQKAAEAASSALRLAEAQDRVKDSAQAVKSAQQAVRDAMSGVRSAQQDAARAAEDAADRQAQAASRIADSERSVQDAHRATQRAIEDLTRAREAARERIEDLALATERGALSEERAQLSIKRAQAELARINADPKASGLDKSDADLRLREAELALREIQERNGDLAKERADSDKKGVEGSNEVVAAKERILDAQQREADAERSLADARAESARVARDGAREVADAQSKIADAQRKVADAQQAAIKAQRDHLRAVQALKVEQLQQKAALEQTSGAAGGAASAMSKLSDEEKKLAKSIKDFKDDYLAWQRSLQPDVFPVIEKGLGVLRVGMDRATPLVKGGAEGLDRFADAAKKALESKAWTDFFDDLGRKAPDAIAGLGDAAINVAGGLRGVVEAFLPYTGQITDWVKDITADFEGWGTSLKDSPEFHDFLEYAKENGPKVAEVLGNIFDFASKVAQVGAGVGSNLLDFLVTLSDKLAGMSREQIEAIAKGVGLIVAAVKIGATLKIGALVLLADVLSGMSPGQIQALAIAIGLVVASVKGYQTISGATEWFQGLSGGIDKAGKSAGSATGKLSGLGGLFKGGVIAAAVTGLAVAFDQVGDALDGLNPNIADLSKNLLQFGRDGKPAADLLDQLNPKTASLVGHFENFGDSASRLASDNPFAKISDSITGLIDDNFGIQLDGGRQAIDNLDKALAESVASGNAEGAASAFDRLAKLAQDAGVPVEKLRELFPQYAQSMEGVPATTGDVGTAIGLLGGSADGAQKALGEAAQKLSDWKSSLDEFNSQTDAAQAVREMEKAFTDVETAIKNANGKLELTPGLTGKQRDAVLLARDAFAGYLEKVQVSADAQATLSGRTIDARDAILKQLPQLFDLAGKNKDAKDQILLLAQAYGISEDDAHKAAKGGSDLVEVLAKLKSKDVRIGVDTHDAQQAIDGFIKLNSGRRISVQVYAKQERAAASGAIMRYAAGGIHQWASGGIERMAAGGSRPQPPGIASKPTILYGEGSSGSGATEAFIPYESRYRDRAIALLSQVANDFGLQLGNKQAERSLSDLSVTIDGSGMQVATGLESVMGALQATMGQAGSLTSSIAKVGSTADQLDQAWLSGSQVLSGSLASLGDGVSSMSATVVTSVDGLTASVQLLGEAVSAAAGKAAAGSKGGSKTGMTAKETRGSLKGGFVAGNQPLKKPQDMIEGNQPLTGYAYSGGSSLSMGAPVNSSRVSAPQQVSPTRAVASSGGGSPSGGGSGGSGPGGASVNFYGTTISRDVDTSVVTARIGQVLDSRG